ncbi:peptidoglycan-binding protein [Actinokineospora sp. UTMC 2448]|uniref:peptidoglycan-binding domain-containing protein n=1 Tax=Actinokineospora sp. UTMC 2448 TaxID=2268449 RepID=UPI002164B684|nr:peptidoglycan-binding domain-containing protein [Actinokineospora sp. UTMC 2448]UVS77583.1 hypothetical protein Actkin_01298 [Actinokineospora sp. UTMC 2448]
MAEMSPELQARLAAFQLDKGLSGDGVAGPKTWELLAKPAPRQAEETVVIDFDEHPVLRDLLVLDGTEDSAKEFLKLYGIDVDAYLADHDAVIAALTPPETA